MRDQQLAQHYIVRLNLRTLLCALGVRSATYVPSPDIMTGIKVKLMMNGKEIAYSNNLDYTLSDSKESIPLATRIGSGD